MNQQHTLFVCTICASTCDTNQRRGGDQLFEQLKTLSQDWHLRTEVMIQSAECFGVCNQNCAIALSAPGKNTYLLANLTIDGDQLKPVASAILEYTSKYFDSPDGLVKQMQCPDVLRKKALARIPPLLNTSGR